MNTDDFEITEDNLTSIKFESMESTKKCSIGKKYCIDKDGLLTYKAQNECQGETIIVEVEFLLKIEKTKIKDCSINIVKALKSADFKMFKNPW